MIQHAGEGLRAIVNPTRPSPLTYLEGSFVGLVAIMVAVAVVPDAVFFWLLIPHRFWWATLALDVADVWGALWLLGLYGTMARRPHVVAGERVTLHNGALQSIAFDRGAVASATVLGHVRRRNLPRRRDDGSLVLAIGGISIVDIQLKTPVDGFSRIFVASDRPEGLCAMMEGGKG